MEISLTESGIQQRCPLCRDDLPSDRTAWAHCLACGTGYHAECSVWAARCALLGCGGSFGAKIAGERFALVVRTGLDYDRAQLHAIAELLGTGVYDAKLKLRGEVPWILGYSSREELDRRRAKLAKAGVETLGVEAARLGQGPQEVVAVTLEGEVLELTTATSGKAYRLDLASPRLVVLGRYEDRKDTFPSPKAKLQDVYSRRFVRREREVIPFAHVYTNDGAPPLAVTADRIRDYRFLGDAMLPSGVANFRRLTDLLCRGARVSDVLRRLTGQMSIMRKDSITSHTTNRPWFIAASTLLALGDVGDAH